MPYDPTKPANNSLIVAAELRSQFAALKTLLDNLQTQVNELPPTDTVTDLINANSAGPCMAFDYLNLTVSDPPTQAEMQTLATRLDDMLGALKRI